MNTINLKIKESSIRLMALKTVNVQLLLETLHHKGIISEKERKLITNHGTNFKISLEMYLVLLRKGPEAFELLYESLTETNNFEVADILKPVQAPKSFHRSHSLHMSIKPRRSILQRSKTAVEEDVTITEAQIPRIVEALDTTIAHSEWPAIVGELLDECDRLCIDNLPETTTYESIFEKTLQLWIHRRRSAATLNELLRVLSSKGQDETVEYFLQNHPQLLPATCLPDD